MLENNVSYCDESDKIVIEQETFKKLQRMVNLIGDEIKSNKFYNFLFLLFCLDNYLEIRIPYVIEKNYDFFSQKEKVLLKILHEEVREIIDKYNHDNIPHDLSDVNQILNKFMSLYDTITNFFELRMLVNKREALLNELQLCLNGNDYLWYKSLLIRAHDDIECLKKAVGLCEKIIIEDWKKKLTIPEEYRAGDNFAFICHAGSAPTKFLVSASLLTDKIFSTYQDRRFGFILDPSSIFHTSPYDCLINNSCSDMMLAIPSHDFLILTKDTLESQTIELGENNYNEICLNAFKPIGIFILLDDENDSFFYDCGQELHKEYPTLPLVYINKSLYNHRRI